MSKKINEQKAFLHLLLNTTKEQARALLYTVTPSQILVLSEIALNLLELPLPPNIESTIHKRKGVLKKLGDKTPKGEKQEGSC